MRLAHSTRSLPPTSASAARVGTRTNQSASSAPTSKGLIDPKKLQLPSSSESSRARTHFDESPVRLALGFGRGFFEALSGGLAPGGCCLGIVFIASRLLRSPSRRWI